MSLEKNVNRTIERLRSLEAEVAALKAELAQQTNNIRIKKLNEERDCDTCIHDWTDCTEIVLRCKGYLKCSTS